MSFTLYAWSFVCTALGRLTSNDTLQQFVNLSVPQQTKLLTHLAQHSSQVVTPPKSQAKLHNSWLYYFQGIRQHFQLPCSYATRVNRAKWIEARFSKEQRVLILGDDDLLTIEMCSRGFEQVIAADCDPSVLDALRRATSEAIHGPLIVQGNFLDRNFMRESGADVICIDPPYNRKWSLVFIDQALRSAGAKADVSIMLMLNPDCFTESDLQEIEGAFRQQGFHLQERVARFNSYPLKGLSAFFLWCGIRMVVGKGEWRKKIRGVHFSSDLFVYTRGKPVQLKS